MLVPGRYRVECDESEEVDGVPIEPTTFKTMDRARALALCRLAYGYECHVLDLVAGQRVFPREEGDGGDLSG